MGETQLDCEARLVAEHVAQQISQDLQRTDQGIVKYQNEIEKFEKRVRETRPGLNKPWQLQDRAKAVRQAELTFRDEVVRLNRRLEELRRRRRELMRRQKAWDQKSLLQCSRVIVRDLMPSLLDRIALGKMAENGAYLAETVDPLVRNSELRQQVAEMLTMLGFTVIDTPCGSAELFFLRIDDRD